MQDMTVRHFHLSQGATLACDDYGCRYMATHELRYRGSLGDVALYLCALHVGQWVTKIAERQVSEFSTSTTEA